MATGQAIDIVADQAQTVSPQASQRGGFILSRPSETVEGRGIRTFFNDAAAAGTAHREGQVSSLVGALPFDPDGPCALFEPEELHLTRGPWQPSAAPTQWGHVGKPHYVSSDDAHAANVSRALDAIAAGTLEKVVLSRRAVVGTDNEIDPRGLLARLVAGSPSGNGYLVELGDPRDGVNPVLVGSSPEVLVRRRGLHVSLHPLAGSAARGGTGEEDAEIAERLLGSEKDSREHAVVVNYVRNVLGPLCRALEIPQRPTLTSTGQLWHLGTPIVGTLKSPDITAFDLARALHPTPAVGGTPAQESLDYLRAVEPERGYYAGAVGWCDGDGDGEWMVAIRCGEVAADRRSITVHAGGGIVAGSDPALEVAETHAKFGTVLSALQL